MVAALVVVLEIVRGVVILGALECVAEGVKVGATINVPDSVVTSVAERVPVSVSQRAQVLVQHNVEMDVQLHVRPFAIKDVEGLVQGIVLVLADLVAKINVCIPVPVPVESRVYIGVLSYAPRVRSTTRDIYY